MSDQVKENQNPSGVAAESPLTALQQFDLGKRNFGFIEGPRYYIVTDNDFCHQLRSVNENIELRSGLPWDGPDEFAVLTLADIRALARPVKSYRDWAHYWGLKPRIGRNYSELLSSMRDIGVDTSGMPRWGEEPVSSE